MNTWHAASKVSLLEDLPIRKRRWYFTGNATARAGHVLNKVGRPWGACRGKEERREGITWFDFRKRFPSVRDSIAVGHMFRGIFRAGWNATPGTIGQTLNYSSDPRPAKRETPRREMKGTTQGQRKKGLLLPSFVFGTQPIRIRAPLLSREWTIYPRVRRGANGTMSISFHRLRINDLETLRLILWQPALSP